MRNQKTMPPTKADSIPLGSRPKPLGLGLVERIKRAASLTLRAVEFGRTLGGQEAGAGLMFTPGMSPACASSNSRRRWIDPGRLASTSTILETAFRAATAAESPRHSAVCATLTVFLLDLFVRRVRLFDRKVLPKGPLPKSA
jgi:hypothetical protein